MEKTDKQMLKDLLTKYKAQLEKEQQLLKEYKAILKEWDNQVENGCECRETGDAVDKAYHACELAKIDTNTVARLALKYVMKIEKEANTSE